MTKYSIIDFWRGLEYASARIPQMLWPSKILCADNDSEYILPYIWIILTILTGRLSFTKFSIKIYWNNSLAASDLFPMFGQPIKSYTFHCHMLKSTDVWKTWFIEETEMNGCLFQYFRKVYGKIWADFYLNRGKRFS